MLSLIPLVLIFTACGNAHNIFWPEILKEKDCLQELDVDLKKHALKWIFTDIGWEGVAKNHLTQNTDPWRANGNTEKSFLIP